MLEKWEIVTRKENNGENILPDIVKSIKEKNTEKSIETDDILGIGMGVPGPITEDGRVLKCANLGWGIFSVADEKLRLVMMQMLQLLVSSGVAADAVLTISLWLRLEQV